jgi:threonine/homoserine/homoserine lactone efflux protein
VLLRAIGEVLPAALGVALNPFPIIAIVLLLSAGSSRRSAAAFAFGWVLGLTALTTLALFISTRTEETDGSSSVGLDVLQVVLGVALLALAWRKWQGRPRRGEEVVAPKWMNSLNSLGPRRALTLGAGLAGVNPKNFAFIVSATASITDLSESRHDIVLAGAVFVLLGSIAVLGLLLFSVIGGTKAEAPLEDIKSFMLANNAVIIMVVLLILGVKVLGDGLGSLAS